MVHTRAMHLHCLIYSLNKLRISCIEVVVDDVRLCSNPLVRMIQRVETNNYDQRSNVVMGSAAPLTLAD